MLALHATRPLARARLLRALDELAIDGLATNIPLLRAAVAEDRFARAMV